jgi:Ca2+/Na+ antiporter
MYHEKLIFSSFVSCIFLLVSHTQVSSRNQPASLGSICCCIIFLFRIYHGGTFHHAHQRWLPYFPKKNPSETAGNGVSMTCCTPRHSMREVAPPQFLHTFLIFISQKITAYVFKHFPDSSLSQMQLISKVKVLK